MFVRKRLGGGSGEKGKVVWRAKSIRGWYFFEVVNGIDPSAGSPTETLLRLLLPRNVQI